MFDESQREGEGERKKNQRTSNEQKRTMFSRGGKNENGFLTRKQRSRKIQKERGEKGKGTAHNVVVGGGHQIYWGGKG